MKIILRENMLQGELKSHRLLDHYRFFFASDPTGLSSDLWPRFVGPCPIDKRPGELIIAAIGCTSWLVPSEL
jgi:hypothetical protein